MPPIYVPVALSRAPEAWRGLPLGERQSESGWWTPSQTQATANLPPPPFAIRPQLVTHDKIEVKQQQKDAAHSCRVKRKWDTASAASRATPDYPLPSKKYTYTSYGAVRGVAAENTSERRMMMDGAGTACSTHVDICCLDAVRSPLQESIREAADSPPRIRPCSHLTTGRKSTTYSHPRYKRTL
ncbi:hypothetical protein NDU88_003029 [Pleurodeles waltl]|uniref:Uncharacterized protein n=1 Tax=Pleurodeles waltl TaxID=8319 RepID=A0AAV7MRB9_PLEWA|nr:hypothetical protein NDU88_003029 [Pleurodeles waltl]